MLSIGAQGEGAKGSGGPPPEDDPSFARVALRAVGLLTLAFGFALGLTLMLLVWLLPIVGSPTGAVQSFVSNMGLSLWGSFLFGFIGGIIIASVYNLLTVRRLNICGIESSVD